MNAYMSSAVYIPLSEIEDAAALRDSLTVETYDMGETEPRTVVAYTEDVTGHIGVPRQFGVAYCEEHGIAIDFTMSEGTPVAFSVTAVPRDYQVAFLDEMTELARTEHDFVAQAATGKGKCLGGGTPVLMYSGEVRKVEEIQVGDLLMGPDSTPRKVLSLARGRETMYRVAPAKGDAYVVNESHILSLRMSGTGRIVDISVHDYLQETSNFRRLAKGWRTGVEFSEKEQPIPPYILGVWLGDGSTSGPILHSVDAPVIREWRAYAESLGMAVTDRAAGAACGAYAISNGKGSRAENVVTRALRDLGVVGNKHVPLVYATGSRQQRLELLAGIVDTDGHLDSNCYEVVSVLKQLADGVAYVARSLGLAAYVYPCTKGIKSTGFSGAYYRVRISGDIDTVPVRLDRRRAAERRQIKNVLNTGITVTPLGEGDYYGFEIDGDRRFLLGDFTVTHNTFMSLLVAARLGVTTLVVVDQDNLLTQWVQQAKEHLGLTDDDIGIVQGPRSDYSGKKLVIAMMQSLTRKRYPAEFYEWAGLVIFDECHVAGAETFSRALMMFSAVCRFGVSATPKRRDALQNLIEWNLGGVKARLVDKHRKSSVYYLESPTVYSWYANVSPKVGRIINEIAADDERNLLIARAIKWLYDKGRHILVLSDRIEHVEALRALCVMSGVAKERCGVYTGFYHRYLLAKDDKPARRPVGYVRGAEYCPVKLQLVRSRRNKKQLPQVLESAQVIFATYGMFSKGVDVPRLSAGIDCTPRSAAQQTHGRILRAREGKATPIWVTVRDVNCYRTEFQFAQRVDEYVKSSGEIYLWDIERGIKRQDAAALRREALRRSSELRAGRIVAGADGRNVILLPTRETP